MRAPRRPWPPAEEAYLREHYALLGAAALRLRLRERFGVERTERAIRQMAMRWGVRTEEHPGLFTLAQAARLLGTSAKTVRYLIAREALPVTGTGQHRFLAPDHLEHLRQILEARRAAETLPEPTLTVPETMQRLGYCYHYVLLLLKSGLLQGYRPGKAWRVSAAAVDALAAEMRARGEVCHSWGTEAAAHWWHLGERIRSRRRAPAPEAAAWLTLTEAAQRLQRPRREIGRLVRTGVLAAKRSGDGWLIPVTALAALAPDRRPA